LYAHEYIQKKTKTRRTNRNIMSTDSSDGVSTLNLSGMEGEELYVSYF
jgi:hypothetical protein